MARRSEHTQEEIRQMVLNAAEAIVAEEGPGALKVRNIALEIGYTVGSVYMVFDNMADLILHLKGRTLDSIAEHLVQPARNLSAEQSLLQLAQAYLYYAKHHHHRWQMLFAPHPNQVESLPGWYLEKIEHLFQPVEQQLQRLQAQATPTQLSQAARTLWSGVHGTCFLALSGSLKATGAQDAEAMVTLLTQNFIHGWVARPLTR